MIHATSAKPLTRKALRELKKEALQLQADVYRLQMITDWYALQKPFGDHLLKGVCGHSAKGWVNIALSALLGARFSRVLPLVMTGWRVAKLLRSWLGSKQV